GDAKAESGAAPVGGWRGERAGEELVAAAAIRRRLDAIVAGRGSFAQTEIGEAAVAGVVGAVPRLGELRLQERDQGVGATRAQHLRLDARIRDRREHAG